MNLFSDELAYLLIYSSVLNIPIFKPKSYISSVPSYPVLGVTVNAELIVVLDDEFSSLYALLANELFGSILNV